MLNTSLKYSHGMSVRTALAAACIIPITFSAIPAKAQTVPGLVPDTYFNPPVRIIDTDIDRRGEQIKQKNYRSDQLGQQGGLNLDLGNFARPGDEHAQWWSRNELADDRASSYSGARFRIPLGRGN